MMRPWAKREEQFRGVVEPTAGLYGDLQWTAGRSLRQARNEASLDRVEGCSAPGRSDPPDHRPQSDGDRLPGRLTLWGLVIASSWGIIDS